MSFQKSRYIGSRGFYSHVLAVAVPIAIQNGITNFVGMLDNIMVGQVGTDQMSGVSIVNQLLFVYNLMIFGGLAGIGIFTAQFSGKGDEKGVRYTMRLKLVLALVLTAASAVLFALQGENLVRLWLTGDSGSVDAGATMAAARQYLLVMYAGLLPFAVSQVYSGTLRECGETVVPMKAGIAAVFVNLIGNYILIYGKFGAPAFGVAGAAAATVLSRFVEAAIVIVWTHRHARAGARSGGRPEYEEGVAGGLKESAAGGENRASGETGGTQDASAGNRFAYADGLYRGFHIPADLVRRILPKAFPLLMNETMWSLGMTVLSQQYSTLGLDVVAAFNISNTISNVFNIAFIAMGDAISIILGQELGAGKMDTVQDDAARMRVFSVFLCVISGVLLFAVSGVFPRIYNTTAQVRAIAAGLIRISAVFMPVYAYENASYFTLRSGGKTFVTFLFDSCFVWAASIPAAYLFTHFTGWPILTVFLAVQCIDFIKCFIGFAMVRRGNWVHDLTQYAG